MNENFIVDFGEVTRVITEDFNKLINRPSYAGELMTGDTDIPQVPSSVSELNNDSNYQTGAQVSEAIEAEAEEREAADTALDGRLTTVEGIAATIPNLQTAVDGKQDKLIAGANINIAADGKTISATDTTYTAGNAIDITNGEISADIHPADFFTASDSTSECGSNLSLDNTIATMLKSVELKGDTFQQTYSGKNLFNYQGVVNLAIATTIAGMSTYRGYYIQANAGDTFTLSRATTTGNNRFRVCFTMVEPARGVDAYNENGVVERYISADDATEVSFTVPQDMHYVFIYLDNSDQDITESLKIQLETGSTATAYEPYVGGVPVPNPDYPQDVKVVTGEQTITISDGVDSEVFAISLGSTELCKIGGYQDYIYKSGDDWYVHKAMGKITLDGSETWSATQMTNNWMYYTINAGMATVISSQVPKIVSNYFSVTTTDGQWTSVAGSKSVALNNTASPNTQIRFTVGDSTNKLADFKTWLSAHNTIVYYALATPTETKITDADLVAQLNAVAGAKSYNNQTNIVVTAAGENLPAILCVGAYQKSLNGLLGAIERLG